MSKWKCEIKHLAYYKSQQLMHLGEQISLFIALYCVCPFMRFIFA